MGVLSESRWYVCTNDLHRRYRAAPRPSAGDFSTAKRDAILYSHGGATAVAAMFTRRGTPCRIERHIEESI